MGAAKPIPEGCEHVIPHLFVKGCAEALDFYARAFGAEEVMRAPAPDGKRIMHAEFRIGGALHYVADDFPEWGDGKPRDPLSLGGSPVSLHRYVTDTDAAFRRAVEAGATVRMPPADMFWGDRMAVVSDPWGHQWAFATHLRDMTPEEMERAQAEAFAGGPGGGCGGEEPGS